jgi:hypothetical protein
MSSSCRIKASKRVQFSRTNNSRSSVESDPVSQSEPIDGSICSFVSSKTGSLACFMIAADKLRVLRNNSSPSQSIRPVKGLHLGSILEKFKMRYGTRPVLAYILAKAVWHYYDSQWMGFGWTNDDVLFMPEAENDGSASYFCKPYLSASFDNPTRRDESQECRQDFGVVHRYPRIFGLGMMLMDIATTIPISTTGRPYEWTPSISNERLATLKSYLSHGKFHDDCQFPRYRHAVEKCLDSKLFQNAPFNPRKPAENLEERRTILYDEIVDPLRQLIEGTGWDAEFGEIERTPLAPKIETAPTTLPSANDGDALDRTNSGPIIDRKRDRWLHNVELINFRLQRERPRQLRPVPTRIAILDTGYSEESSYFDVPDSDRRIKGWKDFVDDSPIAKDTHGHGTHLLTLLLKVAPLADVYVARIAADGPGLKTAEDNISKVC